MRRLRGRNSVAAVRPRWLRQSKSQKQRYVFGKRWTESAVVRRPQFAIETAEAKANFLGLIFPGAFRGKLPSNGREESRTK